MLALLWIWLTVSVVATPVSGFIMFIYAHDRKTEKKAAGWFFTALVAFVSALVALGFLTWWYIVSGLVWFVLVPIAIVVIWFWVTGVFRDLFRKLLTWVKYAKP
ncbi:MAG: hypothetical protein FJX23_07120 [Alphaproteobacteria bacterium]|nr:hypothetical protein [Alphaproteobacteria bacterium]